MSRRTVGVVVGVALVASVLVAGPTVLRGRPAAAEGFNFLFEAPAAGGCGGGGGGSSEFEQIATGMAT